MYVLVLHTRPSCTDGFLDHTKSITQTRFFPDSGHLLLSASADSKIALWDVYHQRELLRTYSGHTKSVNDIDFNPSGTQFVSASYDRYMKLWDTETGKVVNKFTTGKTPHVVRINPSTPHEFLAGMSDKKILQYDTRSGEMVQEYDHHLGPVNTITFCDEVSFMVPLGTSQTNMKKEPAIRHHLGRQVPPCVGVRHSRADQIHCRALHVLHGSVFTASLW